MKIFFSVFFSILISTSICLAQSPDSTGNFTGNYFFTSSAMTLEKSKSMIVWNLYGPEYTYGVTSNFQIGGITSWYASPIALKADLSTSLSKKINVSVGGFFGVDWATSSSEPGVGVNARITFGDKERNISTTLYGFNLSGDGFGQFYSISAYLKNSHKSAFIFETFLFEIDDEIGGVLIPGIQHLTKRNRFFHAGFGIVFYDETFLPLPIPFVQLHVPVN